MDSCRVPVDAPSDTVLREDDLRCGHAPLAAQPHNISASYSCEFVLLAPDDCSELPSDSYFKLHADRFSDPLRSHIRVRDIHSPGPAVGKYPRRHAYM